MQNGFRQGRRGADNLFILTSAIEIARKQKKGLLTCFLHCSKAYDTVPRNQLWETLEDLGMENKWIKLLEAIYTNNSVVLSIDKQSSSRIRTTTGLRQGCPLSPTLFALYIAELEVRLMWTRCGFELSVRDENETSKTRIPGLLFADDLLLIAHTYQEMEVLLSVTTEIGLEKKLNFNPDKSAVVIFNTERLGQPTSMTIQGQHIEVLDRYKYLGITINDGPNYLQIQEQIWKKEANKAVQQLHAQCLWTFNRLEISRVQWKATAVPKLTYANAVLASRATNQLTAMFERAQTAAGRWALGVTGFKVANEFIQGELGWSTFEAREAQSKIRYFTRISAMDSHRWPRMIMSMMAIDNSYTLAVTRLKVLRNKYSCGDIPLEYSEDGRPKIGLFNKHVKTRVRESMEETWKTGMESKSSLSGYRE